MNTKKHCGVVKREVTAFDFEKINVAQQNTRRPNERIGSENVFSKARRGGEIFLTHYDYISKNSVEE